MSKKIVAGFVVLLVLFSAVAAPVAAGDRPLGERIDEAVQRQTKGGYWGAILVAVKGEVVLDKGYGYADYLDRPNTPETLFELASASKQFTAAAILALEEDGRLSITDTIQKFFRGVPKDKRGITVHQLLTHTSGLSPSVGVPYSSPISRDDFVKLVLRAPLDCPPGTKFVYNNPAYALLAAIVEVAAKKPFREYMQERIFDRAGLGDTGLIGDERLIASGRAASRVGEGPPGWSAVDWYWGFGYKGMGGVVTTTGDVLKWDRALRGESVLGAKAKEKLYTPALMNYACGWMVSTTPRGTMHVEHGGLVMGFACQIDRFLEDDVVIVFLSNDRRDLRQLSATVANLIFPAPRVEVDIDASGCELSEYRAAMLSPKASWEIERVANHVVMRLRDGERTAAEIRLPATLAMKVLRDLESAIAVRKRTDPEAPEAMEAGLYLGPYGDRVTFGLTEKLSIVVQSKYVGSGEGGRAIVDPRVLLYVQDAKYRQWPVMVKMNVAAAESFAGRLREAAGGKSRR